MLQVSFYTELFNDIKNFIIEYHVFFMYLIGIILFITCISKMNMAARRKAMWAMVLIFFITLISVFWKAIDLQLYIFFNWVYEQLDNLIFFLFLAPW